MEHITVLPNGCLDAPNAAAYIGRSQKTLATWRCNGTGPAYIKRGRIFYRKCDLDVWIEQGLVTSTTQAREFQKRKNVEEKQQGGRI
jgi:hypothetical protein